MTRSSVAPVWKSCDCEADRAVNADDADRAAAGGAGESAARASSPSSGAVDDPRASSVLREEPGELVFVRDAVHEPGGHGFGRQVRRAVDHRARALRVDPSPLREPPHHLFVEHVEDRPELLALRIAHRFAGELLAGALEPPAREDLRLDPGVPERAPHVAHRGREAERREHRLRPDEDLGPDRRDVDLFRIPAERQMHHELAPRRTGSARARARSDASRSPSRRGTSGASGAPRARARLRRLRPRGAPSSTSDKVGALRAATAPRSESTRRCPGRPRRP